MGYETSPEGPVMHGAAQDEHTFVGIMHASQLFAFAPDPMKMESIAKGKAREPDLEDISVVRMDVQRMFEGAKRHNVSSYAEYITRLYRRQIDGALPHAVLRTVVSSAAPVRQSPKRVLLNGFDTTARPSGC